MDHIHQREKPRYLDPRKRAEDWPLGPPSEPVSGMFLLGALVLSVDFWLISVLAIRWLM
jgi:hypothetical protein